MLTKRSPDAAAILALPHIHHPRLAEAVRGMAAISTATLKHAQRGLAEMCEHYGITQLDIEMCQPSAPKLIPFAVSAKPDENPYEAGVRDLVHAQLEKARPR